MNNDLKTTAAASVSASGYVSGLLLLPPPWNIVAIVVGAVAQLIHGFYSNKLDQE